jgi:hypothetical protein
MLLPSHVSLQAPPSCGSPPPRAFPFALGKRRRRRAACRRPLWRPSKTRAGGSYPPSVFECAVPGCPGCRGLSSGLSSRVVDGWLLLVVAEVGGGTASESAVIGPEPARWILNFPQADIWGAPT